MELTIRTLLMLKTVDIAPREVVTVELGGCEDTTNTILQIDVAIALCLIYISY